MKNLGLSRTKPRRYQLRKHYDWAYRHYPQRLPWAMAKFDRQLSRVLEKKKVALPMKVLDLGCGTGRNTRYLASKGFDVVGIDFSRRALKLARRKKISSLLILGDAAHLPFKENTFDLIVDVGCFHCLPPHFWAAVRSEVLRVLKPQGLYCLKLWYNQQGRPGASRPMFWLNQKIPVWGFNMDLARSIFSNWFSSEYTSRETDEDGYGPFLVLLLKKK